MTQSYLLICLLTPATVGVHSKAEESQERDSLAPENQNVYHLTCSRGTFADSAFLVQFLGITNCGKPSWLAVPKPQVRITESSLKVCNHPDNPMQGSFHEEFLQ